MSNLSDIGFPVKSSEDVNKLIEIWIKTVEEIPCRKGWYLKFSDDSGAEIYLQKDFGDELTGFNPYFKGKSRRKVFLTKLIERDTSELDGAFYAWANAEKADDGDYPFVFDVPIIFAHNLQLPTVCEIQLNAFASNNLRVFDSEEEYKREGPRWASQSFVPSGLFHFAEDGGMVDTVPPQAHAILAGFIKEFELKTNQATNEKFYWFLVETFGGEIDVLADEKLITKAPQINGILQGSFWLTGKVLD